ncbi:MAG: imidazole glycerol phosphate synthase subunit HisH [Actinomycetota bacterium]
MRAGIVDYQMGNLASVSKALERVGVEAFVSPDPALLEQADLIVLPGVGNFAAGMSHLREGGQDSFVKDWAGAGRPLLGICLGMQLLFEHSAEGNTAGLGVIPGNVVRLDGPRKVPHMGWNTIRSVASPLFAPFEGQRFYFVHSYICIPARPVACAVTSYGEDFVSGVESGRDLPGHPGGRREDGEDFVSGVESGRIVGVQFHPEKSSAAGLAMLGRLVEELD